MPGGVGAHKRIFDSAIEKTQLPSSRNDIAVFLLKLMESCEKQAKDATPGMLGRYKGDWFEWGIAKCIEMAFGRNSYQTKEDIKLKDIDGFEFEEWIPCPDIIVKDTHHLKAVISAKWGLRPDRRYEEPFVGMEMKRIEPSVKYLVVTNDASPQNIQMLVDSKGGVDRVYHLEHEKIAPKIKGRLYSFADLIDDLGTLLDIKPKI